MPAGIPQLHPPHVGPHRLQRILSLQRWGISLLQMEIGEYNIKFDVNIVLWMKVEKLVRIELYTNNELWKLFNIGFFLDFCLNRYSGRWTNNMISIRFESKGKLCKKKNIKSIRNFKRYKSHVEPWAQGTFQDNERRLNKISLDCRIEEFHSSFSLEGTRVQFIRGTLSSRANQVFRSTSRRSCLKYSRYQEHIWSFFPDFIRFSIISFFQSSKLTPF